LFRAVDVESTSVTSSTSEALNSRCDNEELSTGSVKVIDTGLDTSRNITLAESSSIGYVNVNLPSL
jgi:hypothetical protein